MRLSEVRVENESFRFDSEYFKKEYLDGERYILNKKYKLLKTLSIQVTDFGAYSQNNFIKYQDHGDHYFIRNKDIIDTLVSNSKVYIDQKIYDKLTLKLEENDLLVQRVGSIGKSAIILKKDLPSSANQNLAQIKLNQIKINPYYVLIFLESEFGKLFFKRLATGNVQPWLNLSQIQSIKIPVLSKVFQSKIEFLVTTAHEKLEQSKALYAEAEHILLKELDLLDFKPSTENIAIKTLGESFGATGRIDAEYYQPKYEEVLKIIQKTPYDILGNIVSMKKSIEPGSNAYCDTGIPFVRVANLSKEGISHSNIYLNPTSFDNKKLADLQPKKNTILFSKDGTVGIAYNTKTQKNIITSGALLHLRIRKDNILPEYLTLVLNSIIVQMQSDRDVGGSIIKHWIPSEIEKITIPLIALNIQQQIENKIQQSFILRKESKHLLKIAKQAVELAIEENEDTALNWINEQRQDVENKL